MLGTLFALRNADAAPPSCRPRWRSGLGDWSPEEGSGDAMTYDVVILGGGPAGLSAAQVAARNGLCTLLVDRHTLPADEPSGEGLFPMAVTRLARLGISRSDLLRFGRTFSTVRFVCESGDRIDARLAEGPGIALSRWQLSALLLSRARRQPLLHVREGVPARVEQSRQGRATVIVGGATLTPPLVIAAEGAYPGTRRASAEPRPDARHAVRQQFATRLFSEHVEVHFCDGARAFVVPLADDRVEITCIWDRARPVRVGDLDIVDFLKGFPSLGSRIAKARPLGRVRGVRSLVPTAGPVVHTGLLELDASHALDPLTGESIAIALARALLLETTVIPELLVLRAGRQLGRSKMRAYLRAVHRVERFQRGVSRVFAHLNRFPATRRRLFAALSRDPLLVQKLLSVHQSALSPLELPMRSLVSVLLDVASRDGTAAQPSQASPFDPSGAVRALPFASRRRGELQHVPRA